MTIGEDLATWLKDRPDWQQDAVARFCANESLSTDDVSTIADQLIEGTYPTSQGISATDIPGSSPTGRPVCLQAIADVAGVNALLPDQELTFGDTGLTIIYGDNASGKSGYARLIREAVTARIKGDLLGDVFATERTPSAASVRYTVDGQPECWTLGGASHQSLSAVRFYDEMCGDAYVTTASEINYRPSALTLLDRLSAACDQVQAEIARRLAENAQMKPELPMLSDGTAARRFLDSLGAETTPASIDQATTLGPDHEQTLAGKLQEEGRLKGSDPTKEKARLAQLATYWLTVHGYVGQLTAALSPESIGTLRQQRDDAATLAEAAKIASARDFDAEPLAGVGSATWRRLWEAARDYSAAEAYHEHEFPRVGDSSRCVLCQQPLGPDGADRLTRFHAFVTDTTSRDADAASRRLAAARDSLAVLQSQPSGVTTALGQLQAHGEQIADTQDWISKTTAVVERVVQWLDGTAPDLTPAPQGSPLESIKIRADALSASSTAIDASSFGETLRALTVEIAGLQAHGQLAAAKPNLAAEVDRLKARARIEKARRLTDTTGITRKRTELTTTHVTSIVRDQFTRETERLHLRRVTLDPAGGRKNATLEHRPKLLGTTMPAGIDTVLSEGEQTALGLAGFLTEVMFDTSKSGIVLDDPVSSLDAGRRSRVATRLVELAQDRQVIVFTHEATFVTALNKAARDHDVSVTERSIIRQGDRPGKASDKHPWNVKDTKARIGQLEADLARLRRDRSQLDSDEYTARVQEWGGHLSQAWERAINLDVVNELVDRGTNEVKPRMFKLVAAITPQDDTDFQSGYAKASEWAPRHDQAPETNFVAPEPDELETELTRFKEWSERLKKYKK